MKTKLMALESISRFIGALGVMVNDPDSDGDIVFGREVAAALEADIAKPVEPFAWCIDSKNSADWCFSATESGVKLNAELMHEDCEKTEPFPVFTTPQEPAAAGWMPIETAPTGTMILMANMNAMEARSWCFVGWMVDGRVCGHRMDEPTHWMQLPAAPGCAA